MLTISNILEGQKQSLNDDAPGEIPALAALPEHHVTLQHLRPPTEPLAKPHLSTLPSTHHPPAQPRSSPPTRPPGLQTNTTARLSTPTMSFVRAVSRARPSVRLAAPAARRVLPFQARRAFGQTAARKSDDPHAEESFEEFSARYAFPLCSSRDLRGEGRFSGPRWVREALRAE
jgi:hypothetical protein